LQRTLGPLKPAETRGRLSFDFAFLDRPRPKRPGRHLMMLYKTFFVGRTLKVMIFCGGGDMRGPMFCLVTLPIPELAHNLSKFKGKTGKGIEN